MRLLRWLRQLFAPSRPPAAPAATPRFGAVPTGAQATWEVSDPRSREVKLRYSPQPNGIPDAGEIVWAWVPFQEDPDRGKDRPMLVIARQDTQRVFALKLTSRAQTDRRDHVSIGSGPWDRQGRESWVDIDQLYSVHHHGIRREAAPLRRAAFDRVAITLARRHGWRLGD